MSTLGGQRSLNGNMGPPKNQLPAHLLMIISQVLCSIYYVVTYAVLVNGTNRIVLSLYRDIVAMVVLIPAAYFIDKGNRIPLSWNVALQLFILGLTGIYGSNYLLFLGIEYTSAEVSATLQPAIPVFTALIAFVFGVESVHWRRRDGQAKVLGVVASCCGAIVLTVYKGQAILGLANGFGQGWTSSANSTGSAEVEMLTLSGWRIGAWQFGVLCLLGNCLCIAAFMNIQKVLLNKVPAPVSVLVYSYAVGAFLMAFTGLFAVTDSADWVLAWDFGSLLVVLYNGVLASAVNFGIMGWVLHRVGPLFVASYIPLQPVLTAALSLAFLGTTVYLGNVVGAVLVISGLFLLSWSRRETTRLASLTRHIQDAPRDPLFDPLLVAVA